MKSKKYLINKLPLRIKLLINIIGFITGLIQFKYFYNFNKIITTGINRKELIKIKIAKNSNFIFFITDPYYNRLLYKKFEYEPEIKILLKIFKHEKYTFIDAGANLGYWSIIASSKEYGQKKTISIEPLKNNFNLLKLNKNNNINRFKIINLAVGNKIGKSKIYYDDETASNVGASLQRNNVKSNKYEIIKIDKIDNIVNKFTIDNKIILKLDVEGNEINALKGATRTLRKKILIIYEDHGSDFTHKNTRFLLNQKFQIYHIENNELFQIKLLKEIKLVKKKKNKGYNFFATKNNDFINILKKN
mgnify:FL=1